MKRIIQNELFIILVIFLTIGLAISPFIARSVNRENERIHNSGYEAAIYGLPVEACPHLNFDTQKREVWMRGYLEGKKTIQARGTK